MGTPSLPYYAIVDDIITGVQYIDLPYRCKLVDALCFEASIVLRDRVLCPIFFQARCV